MPSPVEWHRPSGTASAQTHLFCYSWIPAFAVMTEEKEAGVRRRPESAAFQAVSA
jgi:hypothetical protein